MAKFTTFEKKRGRAGWLFILPWVIGAAMFFAQSLVMLIRYSFNNVRISGNGLEFKALDGAFENFYSVLFEDSEFLPLMLESLGELLYQVPIIICLSLIVAIILSQDFKGRFFARILFFIPVVVSDQMFRIFRSAVGGGVVNGAEVNSNIFSAVGLQNILYNSGMPEGITNFICGAVENTADLIWGSGVQILIFLIALLSIPTSHYEVAMVEGATAWEKFWFVTFPNVVPFLFANAVYSIVDSFTSSANPIMVKIERHAFKDFKISYSSAMAVIYCIVIILILLIIFAAYLMSQRKHDNKY